MRLNVIKIGGNVIDDDESLSHFLHMFTVIKGHKILVHGGGKIATDIAERLNVPQQMIDGRRITDIETLDVVTMVYAGLVNKKIVAQLQGFNCNAIGICGVDGNLIKAHKREHAQYDYGYVGDVDEVNTHIMGKLLTAGLTPVIAPLTHDARGQLLNTNADTIAKDIAQNMSEFYETTLVYCFEKMGVMTDISNEQSVLATISTNGFEQLKREGKVHSGMLPKLQNSFQALNKGVKRVIIGNWAKIDLLIQGTAGTCIVHE